MRRIAAIGLAALLVCAASLACGGDTGGAEDPTAVDAVDFAFQPADTTIAAGREVTWTNAGKTIHTVKGRGYFSRAIDPGDSYLFTFERPGTYRYLCTLHPDSMRGIIVVER